MWLHLQKQWTSYFSSLGAGMYSGFWAWLDWSSVAHSIMVGVSVGCLTFLATNALKALGEKVVRLIRKGK